MSQTEQNDKQIGAAPEREPFRGTPGRASAIGIAVVVLVLALFIFLHLSGALGSGTH